MRLLLLLPILLLVGCASTTPSAVEKFDQYVYDTNKVEFFDCRGIEVYEEVAWLKEEQLIFYRLRRSLIGPAAIKVQYLKSENQKHIFFGVLGAANFNKWRFNKEKNIFQIIDIGVFNNWFSCPRIDGVPSAFFNEEYQEIFDLYLKELIVERN